MRFCAFLRGVNIKGTSMKMVEVCKVFSDAGMTDVSSVLATGNLIFSSDKTEKELKTILEKSLSEYFNYDAFLFLKNEVEIREIFENNPFESSEDNHVYAFVGSNDIEKILLKTFQESSKSENEDGKIVGKNFYWKVEKGNTLDSAFGKILGKKALKDQLTSRNINTIEKILKKIQS